MKYVLDTNVIKRFGGSKPNKNIRKWHGTVNDSDIFITSLSLQEISKGIALLRKTGKAEKRILAAEIEAGLDQLILDFKDRILLLDKLAAREWGRRLARQGTKKMPMIWPSFPSSRQMARQQPSRRIWMISGTRASH